MTMHELKTDPEVFDAVARGVKTHEIRFNDRGFAVGDTLHLRETWFPGAAMKDGAQLIYTGREVTRTVSHIQTGYGLADGWCILSFTATAAPTDAEELHFNAQRLRNVAALVGLTHTEKLDDATLDAARGAILGQIAGKLRAAPTDARPDELPLGYFSQNGGTTYAEVDPKYKGEPDVIPLYTRPAAQSVRDALEQAAKIPRQYAMELANGAFGKRWPEEATAICNASTNMADRIRALIQSPQAGEKP